MTEASFDEAQLHQALRRRLCDLALMPKFEGAFAQVLVGELERLYPGLALGKLVSAQTVADYFFSPAITDINRLFFAIRKASEAQTPVGVDGSIWLSELALCAAMRCLRHEDWASIRAPGQAVFEVPAVTELLAGIAVAGYLGFKVNSNHVVVPYTANGLDLAQTLAKALYDQVFKDTLHERDQTDPALSDEERTRLRIHFADAKLEPSRAVVHVKLDGNPSHIKAAAQALSAVIQDFVLAPTQAQGNGGLRTDCLVDLPTLQLRLKDLFAKLSRPGSPNPIRPNRQGAKMRKKLFISYSHKDTRWLEVVKEPLAVLQAEGLLEVYDDTLLEAGEHWLDKLHEEMGAAKVGLLLISSPFLSSPFIRSQEVPKLFAQHESAGMRLYPLLVRPCPYQQVAWLKAPQMRPQGVEGQLKAVSEYKGAARDKVLAKVANEIASFVKAMP